jgi:hypothetical protein
VKRCGLKPTEPKGQVRHLMVNGPEDVVPEWEKVDWRHHEDNVRRLRQRIFKAAQEEDLAAVRRLGA